MRMKRFAAVILSSIFLFSVVSPMTASAVTPYDGYIYDHKDNSIPSLNGYLYMDSIDGYNSKSGPFKAPQDIYVVEDDTMYIVDMGNNRVVHMDQSGRTIKIYGSQEGEGKLNGPKGVFVTEEGLVYVADTKNNRIVVFNRDGSFSRQFLKPESPLLGAKFDFLPSKLVVDIRGYMFIVVDGSYQGLLQLDPDGKFTGFFGANHIPFSLSRVISRLIATEEQKAQLATQKPPEFSNLFQDKEGFIYTTTLGIDKLQVKRLSAVGVDTLNTQEGASGKYGDLRQQTYTELKTTGSDRKKEKKVIVRKPVFIDLAVDSDGFISVIDQMNGKVFHYDQLGNLLFSFGGLGSQNGLMVTPSSIAVTSDKVILIADETRNRIDRFRLTDFGSLVHKASSLYSEGWYEKSLEPWMDVLKLNSNYNMAYLAIGKSFHKQEKYKEAMEYFRIARAYKEYSLAYLEYRKNFMRENFIWFVAGVISFAVILQIFLRWQRGRKIKKRKQFYAVHASEGGGNS